MDMVLLDVLLLLSLCHQSCKYCPYCTLLLCSYDTDIGIISFELGYD